MAYTCLKIPLGAIPQATPGTVILPSAIIQGVCCNVLYIEAFDCTWDCEGVVYDHLLSYWVDKSLIPSFPYYIEVAGKRYVIFTDNPTSNAPTGTIIHTWIVVSDCGVVVCPPPDDGGGTGPVPCDFDCTTIPSLTVDFTNTHLDPAFFDLPYDPTCGDNSNALPVLQETIDYHDSPENLRCFWGSSTLLCLDTWPSDSEFAVGLLLWQDPFPSGPCTWIIRFAINGQDLVAVKLVGSTPEGEYFAPADLLTPAWTGSVVVQLPVPP